MRWSRNPSGSLSWHWLTERWGPVYTPGLARTICLIVDRDFGGKNLHFLLIYQKAVVAVWLLLKTLVLKKSETLSLSPVRVLISLDPHLGPTNDLKWLRKKPTSFHRVQEHVK